MRDFLDMITDYQESAPKAKKFSANEIDNLYDDLILKFPDLKFVGSLINLNKIEGQTYTADEKIEQFMRAAELDVSFAPQGSIRLGESTSFRPTNANLMQRMEKLTPDYLYIRWNQLSTTTSTTTFKMMTSLTIPCLAYSVPSTPIPQRERRHVNSDYRSDYRCLYMEGYGPEGQEGMDLDLASGTCQRHCILHISCHEHQGEW